MENQNFCFIIDLRIRENEKNEKYLEEINDSIDLILHAMGCKDEVYKFCEKNNIFILNRKKKTKRTIKQIL